MNQLKQAIMSKDIDAIQSAFITYITSDPIDKSGEIAQALQQIEAQQLAIWDVHNGRVLEHDRAIWTKDYFAKLQSHLITNFSKERFMLICQVGKEAYKEEMSRTVEPPPRAKVRPQTSERETFSTELPRPKPKAAERSSLKDSLSALFGGTRNEMNDYRQLQEEHTRVVNENHSLQRELKQQQYKLFDLTETNESLTKKIQVLEAQLQQLTNKQNL